MSVSKNNLVILAILADPSTGGWPTYTAHLAYGLREAGFDPLIAKLTKTTEGKPRDFGRGLTYWNFNEADLLNATKHTPVIITAIGKNKRLAAAELIKQGAVTVIHDPTELDKDLIETLKGSRVITIRKIIADRLSSLGIENNFVPHPYKRSPLRFNVDKANPVAISRVDFDKNTHLIVEANKGLNPKDKIIIHGTLNTLYESVKLRLIDPDWRSSYAGGWSAKDDLWFAVSIASRSRAVVDLSTIKGDGGGTQYSFLEAMDAMKPLVLHSNWFTGESAYDEMEGMGIYKISTPEELSAQLLEPMHADQDSYLTLLENHEARKIAKGLIGLI